MQYTFSQEELEIIREWASIANIETGVNDEAERLLKRIDCALAKPYDEMTVQERFEQFLLQNGFPLCHAWPARSNHMFYKFERSGKENLMIKADGMDFIAAINQVLDFYD